MKLQTVVLVLACAFASATHADFINGDMQLRDAMYLYSKDIRSYGNHTLMGSNCDVFQLILQVESGEANINIKEGATWVTYVDKIKSTDSMFAYALYKDEQWKGFYFNDANGSAGSLSNIATATFFGYCYSTDPSAYVYEVNWDTCIMSYSDGVTSTVSTTYCTPK